jgi:hypothetical protein
LEVYGGKFPAHAESAAAHAPFHETLAEPSETPAAMMSAEIEVKTMMHNSPGKLWNLL